MAKTKDRGAYQAVSLPSDFVEKVRKHVLKNTNYQSIAEFTKQAVIEKLRSDNEEKRIRTEFREYVKHLSTDRQGNIENIDKINTGIILQKIDELSNAVFDLQKEIKKNRD